QLMATALVPRGGAGKHHHIWSKLVVQAKQIVDGVIFQVEGGSALTAAGGHTAHCHGKQGDGTAVAGYQLFFILGIAQAAGNGEILTEGVGSLSKGANGVVGDIAVKVADHPDATQTGYRSQGGGGTLVALFGEIHDSGHPLQAAIQGGAQDLQLGGEVFVVIEPGLSGHHRVGGTVEVNLGDPVQLPVT